MLNLQNLYNLSYIRLYKFMQFVLYLQNAICPIFATLVGSDALWDDISNGSTACIQAALNLPEYSYNQLLEFALWDHYSSYFISLFGTLFAVTIR